MKKVKRALSSNINSKILLKKSQANYNINKNGLLSIKAQVINSKLIHRPGYNGDYVEYWIEIMTDYKKWIIKKRYSEFYDLNQILMQKIPEINKLFPPKRFFKNSEDTIEERKACFNKYLGFLFKKINIFSFNEVLDFIQMEKKIVELYIKKHTMVKQDQDNYVYQSLKKSFNRMIIMEKMEKSKSVGESLNLNGISSLSTKINSKDEINRCTDPNINIINSSIIEGSDATYEIEEFNSNYYSTLLEYEKKKSIQDNYKKKDIIIDDKRESGTIVIEEFLKNLSQDIENKTDILKSFEDFLKKGKKWPIFSNTDIIKLYVGNINNSTINTDKKWSFNLTKLTQNQKCLSGNNINNINIINDKNQIQRKNEKRLSVTDKNIIKNIGINKIIFKENERYDSEEDDIIALRGLFYYIGNFDNNILLSISCLDLLVKLLDNEFNPEIEIYLKIFKTRRISDYQTMRLEEIIKNHKGGVKATKNALKLLSILMDDKNKECIKKTLVEDENVLKQLSIYNNNIYD